MQEKAKEPEIRFAGFTGAWEQRELGEISEIKTGPFGSSLHASDYVADGVPIITTEHFKFGSIEKNKYLIPMVSDTDHSRLIAYSLKTGDIVFSRVGSVDINALVEPESDGWLFSGRVLRVRSSEKYDSGFLHNLLETDDVRNDIRNRAVGQTMPSINTQILSATELTIPSSKREQQRIGNFFKGINQLLTLHQRKYEKLLNIKKSMLEKMFPKEGEVVPEIRFKGFTGAWEQRVLGDFLEVSMETNSSAKFDKNDVLSISGDYGVVNQIAFQGRSFASNSVVKYGVLHNEDIVYTKSPLKANPYGIIKTNKGKAGIVSPLYAIYHPKNNLVPSFVQSYFEQNERLNNYLRPLVNKGAKNNMLISNEKAISGKVIFPSRKEQEKISALLERVDSLLTLHQRKLEMLKNVKQAFLEKMFV